MRAFHGLALLPLTVLMVFAREATGQAAPAERPLQHAVLSAARPLPLELAPGTRLLSRTEPSDSTRRRPFFLPRPGEHTAYWIGFGTGLALSPLLWCEGSGCGVVNKASVSLLLGVTGAVSGLLLSRTF